MGALEVLLISFGAGVASADCAVDCDAAMTAGVMLLAAPPILAAVMLRDRLFAMCAGWGERFGRLRAARGSCAVGLPNTLAVAGSPVNTDVSTIAARRA